MIIGSHLDTVPNAGAYDGVLGVVMGVSLVALLEGRRLPFQVEVIGLSEEEGVRFGAPFIGSRALIGDASAMLGLKDDDGITVSEAIRAYGLDPNRIGEAELSKDAAGYLEFHIEQGPVLDSMNLPLAVVDGIAGQSRLDVTFDGQSNHAGTTPMPLRRDALTGAAEWIAAVESEAMSTPGLMTTVGRVEPTPNARNVINGSVRASLDVRHAKDEVRVAAVKRLLHCAEQICEHRKLTFSYTENLDQHAVLLHAGMTRALADAVAATRHVVHRMTSGAGHDAMIVARRMPAAMLFLRSPGGVSHHPDEQVLVEDVAAALRVGTQFLKTWEARVA